MSRDIDLYLEDILICIQRVQQYTAGMTREGFEADTKTVDAVIRNLEVMGEAVKHIPELLRESQPSVPWRKVAGFRDVLAHAYFGIDLDIVWDVVANHLAPLHFAVTNLLAEPD